MRDALERLAAGAAGGNCSIVSAWATPDGLALGNDIFQRHNIGLERLIVGVNRGFTSARALRAGLAVAAQSRMG